jgi:multiple sugar transport system substrate-binding protein
MNVFGRRTAALVAVTVLLVSACGTASTSAPVATGGASASAGGDASAAPSSSQPVSGEKVELNLWIFEGEDEILAQFEQQFEQEHPNIDLALTLIPEDLYSTKMATAFAGGDVPDIAFAYDPNWLKSGQFLQVDDYLTSNGVDLSQFAQAPLSSCQLDGKLYCIGSYTGEYVMFYDKALFDAAGIPYLSATEGVTVDEYADIARKIAKDDPDMSKRVWGATTGGPEASIDKAAFLSPDGRKAIGFFDDEPTKHAIGVLAHMANDKSAITWEDLATTGIGDGTALMPTHQIGMTPGDNTALADLEAAGLKVGVAPPYVEKAGDPFYVPMWTDGFGVPTKSAHPEEAKQFLLWLAKEGGKIRAAAGALPLNWQLAKDLDWASDSPERQAMVEMAALGRANQQVPGFAANQSPIIDAAWSAAVADEGGLDGIMAQAAQDMQSQLDKDWATWDGTQ